MAKAKAKVVITDYVSETDEESKILGHLADVTAPLAKSEDFLSQEKKEKNCARWGLFHLWLARRRFSNGGRLSAGIAGLQI